MSRNSHQWTKPKAEKPITLGKTGFRGRRSFHAIPVSRCTAPGCKTLRVVVEGPRGGASLHYAVGKELWWWSPSCGEDPHG